MEERTCSIQEEMEPFGKMKVVFDQLIRRIGIELRHARLFHQKVAFVPPTLLGVTLLVFTIPASFGRTMERALQEAQKATEEVARQVAKSEEG